MTARAPALVIEKSLGVKLEVFHGGAYTEKGVNVPAQDFYAAGPRPQQDAPCRLPRVLNDLDQDGTLRPGSTLRPKSLG